MSPPNLVKYKRSNLAEFWHI